MKKLVSLSIVLFIVISLKAQDGAPLLTHFRESRDVENQSWAICQDNNNIMLFANRKGILSFDGQDWVSIRIPTIPYSMSIDGSGNRIFIGGENNYGYISRDKMGHYSYTSLSGDSAKTGIISKIFVRDSVVWFYGSQAICRYDKFKNKEDLRLTTNEENPWSGMFLTPKNTFINKSGKGLYRIDSDTLFPIVTGYLTENIDILFSLPYNDKMVIVGQSDGKINLFDGIKYYDYPLKDDGYLKDNILSEGIAMGDSLYAFSTLDGGALVIEKNSGKVRSTINNQNDLPDDEVFALGMDRSGGLWMSHQYGLTRADLRLPVGNFSIYPGLTGNLTTSLWHNNELYVATSEGIFYLTEVKNFAEVQVLVKASAAAATNTSATEPSSNQQGTRKNIFSRIFGKKSPKEDVKPVATQTNTPAQQYTKKTVNRVKSINYLYKKVAGFNEKCRQLVSTSGGILAASNKGLFLVVNHKAELISGNRYINFISRNPVKGKYYVAAADGYFTADNSGGKWICSIPDKTFTDPVYSIGIIGNILWLGSDNLAFRAEKISDAEGYKYSRVKIKNDFPQRYYFEILNDSVFLFTETGVLTYDNNSSEFKPLLNRKGVYNDKEKFIYPLSNVQLIRHGEDWISLNKVTVGSKNEESLLKIFNEVVSVDIEKNKMWVIDGENRLFGVALNRPTNLIPEVGVFIKSIYNEDGTEFDLSDIKLNRGDNIVNFDIVAPAYLKKNATQYQYRINKLMPEWSPWSERTRYNLMIPSQGEYTLQVRAKDLWGNIGDPLSVKFAIKAPFTQTTLFFALVVSLIFVVIILFMRFREKQLQKENRLLEQKVSERTAEIAAQKEEITSSIEYASRIQLAMLPEDEHFRDYFSDYFVVYKPRDIVSGDFYWVGENEKYIFFTVADCTGHGVPGAFMSTLGISTLNEIITNNAELSAKDVLTLLRHKVKTSLHQTGKEGEAADGMDIAFCVLHKNRKMLEYSGAYNPLFIQQGNEMKEYKADRMPIGIYYGEKDTFTNYEINLKKGDIVYIFSDGFSDQFGGSAGSKFKKANLKKLFSEIHYKPMSEQRDIILSEFEKWKGNLDQVDDVTIMGIKI